MTRYDRYNLQLFNYYIFFPLVSCK